MRPARVSWPTRSPWLADPSGSSPWRTRLPLTSASRSPSTPPTGLPVPWMERWPCWPLAGSACARTKPCPCSRPPRPTASWKAAPSTSASSSPSSSAGEDDAKDAFGFTHTIAPASRSLMGGAKREKGKMHEYPFSCVWNWDHRSTRKACKRQLYMVGADHGHLWCVRQYPGCHRRQYRSATYSAGLWHGFTHSLLCGHRLSARTRRGDCGVRISRQSLWHQTGVSAFPGVVHVLLSPVWPRLEYRY